jgi:uncharacterized protein (TIGR04255 family)
MARQRHLNNAPIFEAIIDFRVKLVPDFDVTVFKQLKETLRLDYPKDPEESREFITALQFRNKELQQILEDKGLRGYFFKSGDDKNVAQFRRDGFTFSRLRPYTEWETVRAEAKRLWEMYSAKASPEPVTRIAVRYINQLSIPLPIHDFADYLTAPPAIPKTLPLQDMSQFMTRVVVCDAATDIQANIIQALQKGAKSDEVTIILDIDVYSQPVGGFEESEIWPTFDKLRELKNRIFFDSITEETARLFI